MTRESIAVLYAIQFLCYGAVAAYFVVRVWQNHFQRHTLRPFVVSLAVIFGSQALLSLYRLVARIGAIVADRQTGVDSPTFALLVLVNVTGILMLFVAFRRLEP